MNKIKMLLGAALVSGLISTSAFAAKPVSPAVATIGRTDIPHALQVVGPIGIPPRFVDATVKVTFTVDENGLPHDIKLVAPTDRKLAQSLLPALAQWRFSPALQNGVPVAKRVLLPITLRADS